MDYMEWPKTVAIFLKYKYFLFIFNLQSRNTLRKIHSIMSLFCCSECAKMLYSQPQPFCYDRKHFNFDTTDISQSALRFFNTSSIDFFIRKDSKLDNFAGVQKIFTWFIFAGLCGERRPRPRGGAEGQAARLQQRAQDEGAGGGGAAQLHPGHPGQPPAVVPRQRPYTQTSLKYTNQQSAVLCLFLLIISVDYL